MDRRCFLWQPCPAAFCWDGPILLSPWAGMDRGAVSRAHVPIPLVLGCSRVCKRPLWLLVQDLFLLGLARFNYSPLKASTSQELPRFTAAIS